MAGSFSPRDDSARRLIREALNKTLFVEAGAGTGKTTSLVDRVTKLVSSGRTTLDRISAITFTEAAASELRDRIRENLEHSASDDKMTDEECERCRRGVDDLDQASIQTLHSFAGALLRERPLEAGLPPSFETMDAISSELAFEEAWTEWVDSSLEEGSLHFQELSLAFSLGLSVSKMREVALKFHGNYDLLAEALFEDIPRPAPSAVRRLVDAVDELERLCDFSKLRESDALFAHVQPRLALIRRHSEIEPDSPAAYRLLQRMLPLKQTRGRAGDWEVSPEVGQNAGKYLKDTLKELDETANEEIAQARQSALAPILRALKEFVLAYAEERKRQGKAEFHDLLVWARDLLRDNIEVRDHFRARFSHLLIDEAQDTDPIQAEIAIFLAEDVPAAAGDRPTDWARITPEVGKLFVVGDPKQSIYRFRRADARQMARLKERLGGETVQLVQNFRSQAPIVAWVNCVFSGWMGGGNDQAEYVNLIHRWEAATDDPFKPRAWSLGDAMEGNANEIRQAEAEAIADLLAGIDGKWQVLDADATSSSGVERYRPAKLSDTCILMPKRTGLRILELALDNADIPYRLEGASLIFATQEIRDLVNCLKAIDDPADQVAVVAALRSPAFACNDVELLRFHQSTGSFDYLSDTGLPDDPVAQGLAALRGYHEARMWTPIADQIDRFIRERLLMEAALDHPRTREQWRRYRFMVERARAFAEAGGNSLRPFLEWVDRQAKENAWVTETPVPEGDEEAVRIMTIHGAKGLEFPVVVLAGLHSDRQPPTDRVLFEREGNKVEVRIGGQRDRFATPGYEELLDKERGLADDEFVRLMYVAATRARDHLVVSMHRKVGEEKSAAARISQHIDGRTDVWEQVAQLSPAVAPPRVVRTAEEDPEAHSIEKRDEWRRQREQVLSRQGRPASVSASKLASIAKEEPDPEEPWKRGRAGTSIGSAVHGVLQTIDLARGDGIEDQSRSQATAESVPERWAEVAGLVRNAINSEVVKRAVRSGKLWREVPVAVPVGKGVLEGFIDLLFEEDDGLVVVDYKTDYIDAGEREEQAVGRYRLQAGSYALAIQKATGKPVKEIVLLFLQPSSERSLTEVPQLMEEAERRAEAYLESAGALS